MALMEFYGTECPHCIKMQPLVEKLEKEGFKIERYETWHHEKNAELFDKYDKGRCGGVPFFVNTDTDEIICGETDYAELKKWAQGK